jgi:AAA15 family ATPase/GTPase
MTPRGKKIFIVLTVVVPFLIYSIVYYQEKFRYANFKAKDFVSFEYKWGVGENLENSYNSATGTFKYHDVSDSVVEKKLKLTTADFKYLDSIADVQGFWNLPPILANSEADLKNPKILRYDMKFVYKHGEQSVLFLFNYDITERKRSAAAQMQKEIEKLLTEAEKRTN